MLNLEQWRSHLHKSEMGNRPDDTHSSVVTIEESFSSPLADQSLGRMFGSCTFRCNSQFQLEALTSSGSIEMNKLHELGFLLCVAIF